MSRSFDCVALTLVVTGGSLGALARALLMTLATPVDMAPWVTLAINGIGSLLLGVVVGCLGHHRRRLHAFLATGILGGFTTYSAFALDAAIWLMTPVLAGALIAGSLLVGVTGAIVGLLFGSQVRTFRRYRGRGTVA